jgi:hypothetical protein
MIDLSEIGPKPKDHEAYHYIEDILPSPVLRRIINRGGEGSGHFGHKGRPGERGGSQPGEGGEQDEGSGEFREHQKALVKWVDQNWRTINSALVATKWSEVNMASPWMAPDGGIHDTGKTGIRHHQGVLDAFAGSGVWDEESVRSADEAEGDTYTVLSEFMEHGFVGISVDFGGKTYSIRFTDPKDITRGQREALAADVLIAMRQGYSIQAEPSRIGKGPDYYDEDEVLRLLGIERVGRTVERGGPGSGFFAHAGRPGFRGGSLPVEGGERRYMADKDPWPTAYRVKFPVEFGNFSTQRGYQNGTMWGWVNTKYGGAVSHEGPTDNGHESLARPSQWASRGLFGYYKADIPILVVYATDESGRATEDIANAVGNLDAILQAVEYPDDLPLPVLAVSSDAGYTAHRVRVPQLEARGGPGSGHFGHAGRPGERGGSQPGEGGGRDFVAEAHAQGISAEVAASVWGMDKFSDWARGIDGRAQEWFAIYRSNGYRAINEYLREGSVSEESNMVGYHADYVAQAVPFLDAALARAVVPEDVVVYRCGRMPTDDEGDLVDMTGMTFVEKGYTSTSLIPNPARSLLDEPGEVMMRIVVPRGTHAAYTVAATPNILPHEVEVTLARETRFRVRGLTPSGEVELEVVHNGGR